MKLIPVAIIAQLFLYFFSTVAHATQTTGRVLSFEEAAAIALRDNTDIMQIRASEESAKHKETQALSPNSPFFIFNNNNAASPFRLIEGASKTYGLQWTLGFPGKAIIQSKQFSQTALSLREQGYEKEVSILVSLSNLFISISSNHQLTKILEQETERTSEVLKIIERKYSMGQSAQVDLLSSKSAVAKLNHDLLNARETSKVLQAQFLTILRKPEENFEAEPNALIEVPELTLSQEEMIQMMLRNRHLLKANEFQVESASANATSAAIQWLPDIQFNASMNLYSIPGAQVNSSLSRDYSFGFQLVFPIFFPINDRNVYRAARSDLSAAEYQSDSARLQAISDLKTNYTLYQAGFRQLKDMKQFLLPAAKATYDLTLKTYSLGKADYLRLSDARTNWIQTQKDELSKRAELAQLFNNLTLNVGCDFRNKDGIHACQ